jgi:hypothetical protein
MRIPACARALGVSVALSVTAACGGGGGSSSSDPAVVLHTTSVPNGQTGVAYATSFDASFSHPPGRYIKVSGQLPPGLELDQVTGELTGYPRQLGTFRFEIEARDGVDPDAPRDVTFPADRKRYSLLITKGPPNFIPPFTLPSAEYRAPYSHVLDIAGGTPPYRCEKLGGELPNGLSVATNCTVGNFPTPTGTPTSRRSRSAS